MYYSPRPIDERKWDMYGIAYSAAFFPDKITYILSTRHYNWLSTRARSSSRLNFSASTSSLEGGGTRPSPSA